MRSRYEVYVDGVALSSLNPAILITDIAHEPANYDRQTQAIANRNGLMIVKSTQKTTSVEIAFELRIYNIAERQRVLQQIQQWAKGKILETNDREGQQLHVVCETLPRIESVQEWNATLGIGFTAYNKPFWEEKLPSTITLTGDDEEGSLYVPGNAGKAFVEAEITPSEAISGLTVTVGDTTIELEDLNTSDVIKIGYDEYGNQYIKAGATSILSKRTPESSDDLLAECGEKNEIAVSSNHSVTAKIIVRGVWL